MEKIRIREHPGSATLNSIKNYHLVFLFKNRKRQFTLQSLNDSLVPFTYTTLAYAGKPQENPTENYVVGAEETVMKLIEDYKAEGNEVKGRTLYCDRFFGTVELVDRYE